MISLVLAILGVGLVVAVIIGYAVWCAWRSDGES